jgi:hypothetical protein
MNNLISFLLLVSIPSHAKFARTVFDIPCDEIKLEVKECENRKFSNIKRLHKRHKKLKHLHFSFSGALIKGKVLDQRPSRCHKKQNMNLNLYKKKKLKGIYFVKNYNCESDKSEIIVIKPNFFCDTGNSPHIKECFLRLYSRENNLNYTVMSK